LPVTEHEKSSVTLCCIECKDNNSVQNANTAVFNVEAGETVTCVFTNNGNGKIVIVKQTFPSGAGGNFLFTGEITTGLADGDDAMRSVVPGTYTVTETGKSGWQLSGIDCKDNNSVQNGNTAVFNVEAGETVTCVFENIQDGKIVVIKNAVSSSGKQLANGLFDFTGVLSGTIANNGQLMASVAPGTYTTTENTRTGWNIGDIVCSDDDSSGVVIGKDRLKGTITYNVEAGETVTCVVTNNADATIRIIKRAFGSVGGGDTFTYTLTGPGGTNDQDLNTFIENVASGSFDDDSARIVFLVPGKYQVSEIVTPNNWQLTGTPKCTGSSTFNGAFDNNITITGIELNPGDQIDCTFRNVEFGTIIIEKQTNPAGFGGNFGFTGEITTGLSHGEFEIKRVPPGTYTVTETGKAGWTLSGIVCSDGDSFQNGNTAVFNIDIDESVTCVFTNLGAGKIVIVKKTFPSGAGGFFGFTGEITTGLEDGDDAMRKVAPGTYTVTETGKNNWALSGIDCKDNNSVQNGNTAVFNVEAGETVTCVFENTQNGKIVIV